MSRMGDGSWASGAIDEGARGLHVLHVDPQVGAVGQDSDHHYREDHGENEQGYLPASR